MFENPPPGTNLPPTGSGNIVVGGEPDHSNWFSRFMHKIWPHGASIQYKALVVSGAAVLVVVFGGLLALLVVSEEQLQESTNGTPGQSAQGGETAPPEGGKEEEEEGGEEPEEDDGEENPSDNESSDTNGGQPTNNQGGNNNGTDANGGGSSGSGNGGSGNNGNNNGDGGNNGDNSGGGSCAPPNYPTTSCTGWQHTGVTLSAYTGPSNITVDGTVIDGKDIDSCLSVNANNVTIKRSRIRCDSWWVLRMHGNNGLIEDTEISALGFTGANCLEGNNYTARRINCHNTGDGIRLGNNVIIEDSIIHGLVTEPGSHNDSIQAVGAVNSVIRHNYIENQFSQTACIKLGNEFGPLQNILVENNLLNGGGYTVYGGGTDSNVDNIRFINNRFMRAPHGGFFANGGYYGPVSYFDPGLPGNQWAGNVWHNNGATINSAF